MLRKQCRRLRSRLSGTGIVPFPPRENPAAARRLLRTDGRTGRMPGRVRPLMLTVITNPSADNALLTPIVRAGTVIHGRPVFRRSQTTAAISRSFLPSPANPCPTATRRSASRPRHSSTDGKLYNNSTTSDWPPRVDAAAGSGSYPPPSAAAVSTAAAAAADLYIDNDNEQTD